MTLPTGQHVTIKVSHSADAAMQGKFMAVAVFAEGVHIIDREMGPSDEWEFNVGAEYRAYVERIPNIPFDATVWLVADGGNAEPVQVAYQFALAINDAPDVMWIAPGGELEINPVLARRWDISAETWG